MGREPGPGRSHRLAPSGPVMHARARSARAQPLAAQGLGGLACWLGPQPAGKLSA